MGLFGDNRPKVTEREFKKVRTSLRGKGFNRREVERLQTIMDASLKGTTAREKGIDKGELNRAMGALRTRPAAKLFTPAKIDTIGTELKKKL